MCVCSYTLMEVAGQCAGICYFLLSMGPGTKLSSSGLAASAATWTCLTKPVLVLVTLIHLGSFPWIVSVLCCSRVGKAWCHRACLQEAERVDQIPRGGESVA